MPSATRKPSLPPGILDLSDLVEEPTCTDIWCPDEESQDAAEAEMKESTQ